MKTKNYKILITGATGYIGSNLSSYLGKLNYQVETIGKNEFMNEDYRRLDEFKPDVVVHCAWIDNDLQDTDHLEFAELTCHFYTECKRRNIKVINIGSSSEYGVKLKPMREDMICEPITTYGIAKLSVTLFAKKLGFNTLRLFTVYKNNGHSFRDNYKNYKEYADYRNVRDYVTITDVCVAIERLIHAEHLYGEIINVGSGEQKNYAEIIEEEFFLGGDIFEQFNKYAQNQYEPSNWIADTTKMKNILNL